MGTNTDAMKKQIGDLAPYFHDIPELKDVTITTANNSTAIDINLTDKDERKKKGERSVYEIEKVLNERLNHYKTA